MSLFLTASPRTWHWRCWGRTRTSVGRQTMLFNHICLLLEKKLQIFLTRVQIPFSFLTIMFAAKTVRADNGWCSHTGMSFHIYSLPISFCQQLTLNANSFSCDVSLIVEIQAKNKDGGQMQLESWTNWTQVQPTGRFTNGAEWRRSSLVWTLEPPLKGETSQTRIFFTHFKTCWKGGGGVNAHADRIHLYQLTKHK